MTSIDGQAGGRGLVEQLVAGQTLPVRPERPRAHRRRSRTAARPRPDVAPRPARPRPPARPGRRSRSWWTVAPSAASSRDARTGRVGRRARTGRAGRRGPAVAPAAAVRRQWFDQRRPLVTSVSAPSASAAPTRNSRLRSLLPPNASGSRSSRLTQTSTSTAERGGEPRAAAGAATARRTAGSAAGRRRGRTWPDGSGLSSADGHAHHPRRAAHDRRPARGHGTLDRDLAADGRLPSGCTPRSCRRRPGDKTRIHHHGDCETSIYILVRRRPATRGARRGLEHEMTAGGRRRRSTSPPARSTSRRTPRRPSRWSSS